MHKLMNKASFMSAMQDGMRIHVGGFMVCGTPRLLVDWLVESGVKDLTIICNDAGYEDEGVGKLIKNGQVKTLIASHIGLNPEAGRRMREELMDVELVPQGTLAERIRAYGAGLGGVLTPTGIHTIVEEGKQVITVGGRQYILEEALGTDIALIEAKAADPLGNLVYDKTARNFNPVMATSATTVYALVHDMVEDMDPECVVTPHIFVHHIIMEDNHD
jgi:acetate CoA/acetoacetate CoA-transferase alpha subunit